MPKPKLLIAGLGMALVGVVAASGIATSALARSVIQAHVVDPVAALRSALAQDAAGEDGLNQLPKTPRLAALLRRDGAPLSAEEEQEPALDYNFLTGAQEPADVRDVVVTRRATGPRTMTVIATFRIFEGRSRTLRSSWVRSAKGPWLLDDINDGETSLARLLSQPRQ